MAEHDKLIALVYNTSHYVYLFRRSLITALQDQGYRVLVIAPKDEYTDRLIGMGVEFEHLPIDSKAANPLKDVLLLTRLVRVYRRSGPQVLLHFTVKPNIYGNIAAAICGIPSISTITGLGTAYVTAGPLRTVTQLLYRVALRHARHVFFQNEFDRAEFLRSRIARPSKSSVIAGSGIDTDHFRPIDGVAGTEFTFLYVGRMLRDKGLYELIDAVRKLRANGRRFECLLLGKADVANRSAVSLDEISQWQHDGLVRYLGSADDVRPLIANADCVVLPSYREGTSKTLLEAAAMAKPLIATDVPGCNNVVVDALNGYLCQPRDSSSLALAMDKMLGHSALDRIRMGQEGRKHVEKNFSDRSVVHSYLSQISTQLV